MDHTTVYRWAQRDALELDRRCRQSLRATNDSYRIDETYIGDEAMHMLRKGQIEEMAKGNGLAQNRVINQLFGLAA
jgi:hypothetical protein